MTKQITSITLEDSTKWWTVAAVKGLLTLIVIGGMEINPGPMNNAKSTKLGEKLNRITEILGKHTNDTNERLENFVLKWNGLKQEVDTMKKEILNLKEQANERKWIDSNRRKHNLVVFGLEESYKESKWDLCYALVDLCPLIYNIFNINFFHLLEPPLWQLM